MATETKQLDSLVALIDGATAADLEAIDREIVAVDAKIDQAVTGLRRRRESLLTLRKVVAVKVNGKPAKAKAARRTAQAAAPAGNGHDGGGNGYAADSPQGMKEDRRRQIARLLLKSEPVRGREIGRKLNIPDGSLGALLSCGFFEQTAAGFVLTAAGKALAQ